MEINVFGIAGVAVITIICYLIATAVKATPLDNKFLPTICGVSGAILGVVCFYIMPDFPAGDVITSIAVGIVSGLASTGAYEMITQLITKK